MKKLALLLVILLFISQFALAANQAQNQAGQDDSEDEADGVGESNNTPEPELYQNQNQNKAEVKNTERVQARNTEELREMIQTQEMELERESNNSNMDKQKVFQNQNRVRLAVHALLSMENLTGGIGPQVSAIAREFNNSVQKTIQAEEQIQSRSALKRFFSGGDQEAAGEIETEAEQNQVRIQNLNQLHTQCNCTAEVKAMLQEQIQNMEQEQTRLMELAQEEKAKKGLFGWFKK
ncbi:MAG: hypothetical protein ABIG20_01845 [archaeon]